MCNLYTVRKSAGEIAGHFGIDVAPALESGKSTG